MAPGFLYSDSDGVRLVSGNGEEMRRFRNGWPFYVRTHVNRRRFFPLADVSSIVRNSNHHPIEGLYHDFLGQKGLVPSGLWGFRCCCWSTLPAWRRHYSGRSDDPRWLVLAHQRRPSRLHGGLAPALIVSRPAQRSLTLRPACSPSHLSDPLHRRLRRFRFLHRRSDCFRVERTQFPGGTFTRS